jgi:hypothetical protein
MAFDDVVDTSENVRFFLPSFGSLMILMQLPFPAVTFNNELFLYTEYRRALVKFYVENWIYKRDYVFQFLDEDQIDEYGCFTLSSCGDGLGFLDIFCKPCCVKSSNFLRTFLLPTEAK